MLFLFKVDNKRSIFRNKKVIIYIVVIN
jgi:hypothetical protein